MKATRQSRKITVPKRRSPVRCTLTPIVALRTVYTLLGRPAVVVPVNRAA